MRVAWPDGATLLQSVTAVPCTTVDSQSASDERLDRGERGKHCGFVQSHVDQDCHGNSSAAKHNMDVQWRAHGRYAGGSSCFKANSCSFYSEATLLENRAAQSCDGHCGSIVKEECDLTFAWGLSGFYMPSSKGNPSSRRFEHGRQRVHLFRVHRDNNPNQLFGVGALAHRGLLTVRGFVREVPLAFPALHLSAREGCPGHCRTLTPMAVFVEYALVLLTWFFCAVARC